MRIWFRALGLLSSVFISNGLKDKKECSECHRVRELMEKLPLIGYFIHHKKCLHCGKKKDVKIMLCELLNYLCYEVILNIPISTNEKVIVTVFISISIAVLLRQVKQLKVDPIYFCMMLLLMLITCIILSSTSIVHRMIGLLIGAFVSIVFICLKRKEDALWLLLACGFIFSDNAFFPICVMCIVLYFIHVYVLCKLFKDKVHIEGTLTLYLIGTCMIQVIYGVYVYIA